MIAFSYNLSFLIKMGKRIHIELGCNGAKNTLLIIIRNKMTAGTNIYIITALGSIKHLRKSPQINQLKICWFLSESP